MDWIKTVISIKEKLSQHGFDEATSRINEAQMVLGTPGEMYLAVMNELLDLRTHFPKEYQIIEKEVDTLLDYGRSINYFTSQE